MLQRGRGDRQKDRTEEGKNKSVGGDQAKKAKKISEQPEGTA